ncbi:MAG: dihydroxy-acid dehydratase, partial [Paenibacillus sp.]|nr:dihydroxy-acid dehydratase [Paenibacillus sp.]
QAHEGMHYSLASRDFIASMVEIHVKATPFDAMVLSSAGDKAVPAHLMAIARLDIPAIHVPGGAMGAGPCMKSNEELWHMSVEVKERNMTKEQFLAFQRACCPTCGACQYMGTAATMQVMAFHGRRSFRRPTRKFAGWPGLRDSKSWSSLAPG